MTWWINPLCAALVSVVLYGFARLAGGSHIYTGGTLVWVLLTLGVVAYHNRKDLQDGEN